jgi:hypothetical protein
LPEVHDGNRAVADGTQFRPSNLCKFSRDIEFASRSMTQVENGAPTCNFTLPMHGERERALLESLFNRGK